MYVFYTERINLIGVSAGIAYRTSADCRVLKEHASLESSSVINTSQNSFIIRFLESQYHGRCHFSTSLICGGSWGAEGISRGGSRGGCWGEHRNELSYEMQSSNHCPSSRAYSSPFCIPPSSDHSPYHEKPQPADLGAADRLRRLSAPSSQVKQL